MGRLGRSQNKKEARIYLQKARRKIVFEAAARAWALGVPWSDALKFSQRAVAAGNAVEPNAFASGKGRGRGKGKGKGRAGKGKGKS